MLLFQYPGRKPLRGVVRQYGDHGLEENRAAVQLLGHEVDAGAVFLLPRFQGALVSVQPTELRQQ